MSNNNVNVFFTRVPGRVRDEFWGQAAQARAGELGFKVRLNPEQKAMAPEQWAEALAGVEALITTWGAPRLDEKVLSRNDTLRIVGHAGGAVANLVSPELFKRGVPVVTANSLMAQSVAEWCLMVTLLGWQRFLDYCGLGTVQQIQWDNRLRHRSIQEATVAIWGYGDISSRLVRLLQPLEPKEILVYSRHLQAEQAAQAGVTLVGFDELFQRGDIIHLLGAMTGRNTGQVGPRQLAMIHDEALLVNAGRARLVQEEAFLAELRKERFQAILDVHYREPLPADSPFRTLANVIVAPHLAGRGREGLYIPHILEEFDRFFHGRPLVTEISPERATTMSGGL